MGAHHLNLYDLRCFLAVAEKLSFTQAAKELHTSTSPLSRRIRDIERALDVRLFTRDTRRVELTPTGIGLLPIARDIIEKFDDIPRALENALTSSRKSFLYGIPPWLHSQLRKKLIDLEAATARKFILDKWPRGSKGVLSGIHSGRLAFGLVRAPFDTTGVLSRVVCVEELGAVLPKSKYGSMDSVALEELADLVYITAPRGSDTEYRLHIEEKLNAAGVSKRAVAEPGDYVGVIDMISNGKGFAIAPLSSESGAHAYNLAENICLPIQGEGLQLTTCLVWHGDNFHNDSDVREIVETAVDIFCGPGQIFRS